MRHLANCYAALSREAVFYADNWRENSIMFDLQHCALELFDTYPKSWRVKPLLHLILELRIDGSRPAAFWSYIDDDSDGSVSRMIRRRGGRMSAHAAFEEHGRPIHIHQPMLRILNHMT